MAEEDTAVADDKKQTNITDYLQAPRRKRKNYVIVALGDKFSREVAIAVNKFVKTQYKQLAVSSPRNSKELRRQFGRNITLLILDEDFDKTDTIMEMVESLKVKRKGEVIPILFMTRNPGKLIENYQKHLSNFHEVDDYCHYSVLENKQILGRVKIGIDQRNKRKSRRYNVNVDVSFYLLRDDQFHKGKLLDMSIHGAILRAMDLEKFRVGDQMKITLPIAQHLKPDQGEYMNVSAKVRRVLISGNACGVSFEHMSDQVHYRVMDFLTSLVNYQIRFKAPKG